MGKYNLQSNFCKEGEKLMKKQDFLERLEKDRIADNLIDLLKNEKLPLILWGCGDVADAVCTYLAKEGVEMDGVLLDGTQIPADFHGMEVMNRETLQKRFPAFNIILGHSHYQMGEQLKKELPGVHQVYYVFSVHYEQYEKVPYELIAKEAERFVRLCGNLEDEASADNLLAYLNTKMTGDASYIMQAFRTPMSFYHNDVFQMTEEEVFLDIGAYNGDTVRLFLEETDGKYKKIIALEPDGESFLELNEYVARERMKNVVTSKSGAWNKREDLLFKTGNEQISSVDTGDSILKGSDTVTIYGERLDELFGDEEITFIKINYYEGVLEAMEGCEGILCKRHPKLAVDVGFDIYNVLKVSEYISSLNQGYKLYLRFNRAMSSTFTLYALK